MLIPDFRKTQEEGEGRALSSPSLGAERPREPGFQSDVSNGAPCPSHRGCLESSSSPIVSFFFFFPENVGRNLAHKKEHDFGI